MLCAKSLQLYLTLCDPLDQTIACQSPLSMGFSRQKYWSGLPCPPPGELPDQGIKPRSPAAPSLLLTEILLTYNLYKFKVYNVMI